MSDKFKATWVSHSSISDFLKCPRAYYLNNVYKDPKTNHKVTIMNPYLALGQTVHEVVESLSVLPTQERFNTPLHQRFEQVWKKVEGKMGGFTDRAQEQQFKERGLAMLNRISSHPGPIAKLAVKINQELPHFWLSKEDNIILCGKIDWLEYLPDTNQVHIIDFKTGKNVEDKDSLQLPIYLLLVHHCQQRQTAKASYWYLGTDNELTQQILPDLEEATQKILTIAKKIKLARALEKYSCKNGNQGCFACKPLESIVKGQAEFIGTNDFRQDMYVLKPKDSKPDSVIL